MVWLPPSEQLFQELGECIVDPNGEWLHSGHTFRITGARLLASWGLDPITIQLLGRWGSMAVLTYLSESPLQDFADRLAGPLHSSHLNHGFPHSVVSSHPSREWVDYDAALLELRELRSLTRNMSKQIQDFLKQQESMRDELDGMATVLQSRSQVEVWWIANTSSYVLHLSLVDLNQDPINWKTACGWSFASRHSAATYRDEPQLISYRKCPRCFKTTTDKDSDRDSSSTSSDTSDD